MPTQGRGAGVEGWGLRPVCSDRIGPEPAWDGGHSLPSRYRGELTPRREAKEDQDQHSAASDRPPRSGLVQRQP